MVHSWIWWPDTTHELIACLSPIWGPFVLGVTPDVIIYASEVTPSILHLEEHYALPIAPALHYESPCLINGHSCEQCVSPLYPVYLLIHDQRQGAVAIVIGELNDIKLTWVHTLARTCFSLVGNPARDYIVDLRVVLEVFFILKAFSVIS